jgi:hypothetical protein
LAGVFLNHSASGQRLLLGEFPTVPKLVGDRLPKLAIAAIKAPAIFL